IGTGPQEEACVVEVSLEKLVPSLANLRLARLRLLLRIDQRFAQRDNRNAGPRSARLRVVDEDSVVVDAHLTKRDLKQLDRRLLYVGRVRAHIPVMYGRQEVATANANAGTTMRVSAGTG